MKRSEFTRWAAVLIGAQMLFGCSYARMTKDEAVHTYEIVEPKMAEGTVPVEGGVEFLRIAKAKDMKNPIAYSLASARVGQIKYNWYCIQCHGPAADGLGTVGQSFVPLPFDLKSSKVQSQSDGQLFKIILFGRKKMPPLVETVTPKETWNIINYTRWLGKQPKG
ncbi:MAG: c-type cytochrome [Syntrophobacteraceae bacterium]